MIKKNKNSSNKYIKPEGRKQLNDIQVVQSIEYPLFSFRWLIDYSIDVCKDYKFFHSYLIRLQKLSELGWDEIHKSSRHSFGMEKMPIKDIKPKLLPPIISPDVKELDVFRAVGDNRPMIGFQEGKIFHVIFIEAKFGDVYEH